MYLIGRYNVLYEIYFSNFYIFSSSPKCRRQMSWYSGSVIDSHSKGWGFKAQLSNVLLQDINPHVPLSTRVMIGT